MKSFTHINEIKELNDRKGYHFFKDDTINFFNSIVYPEIINGNIFITSERHQQEPRKYTVRLARDNGQIETIGKFQQFKSKKQATRYAESLPAQLPEALDYFIRCWNMDTMHDFLTSAVTEPANTRPNDDLCLDSFCGSCYWLMEHAEEMDSTIIEMVARDRWEDWKREYTPAHFAG